MHESQKTIKKMSWPYFIYCKYKLKRYTSLLFKSLGLERFVLCFWCNACIYL